MTREEAIEIFEDLYGAIEDSHGRDYDEAFRMAIEALTADSVHKPDYSYEAGMVRRLKEAQSADAVKVAYICDGRKCDKDCSECFRTLDIEHARDFKRMGGTYYQQEEDFYCAYGERKE